MVVVLIVSVTVFVMVILVLRSCNGSAFTAKTRYVNIDTHKLILIVLCILDSADRQLMYRLLLITLQKSPASQRQPVCKWLHTHCMLSYLCPVIIISWHRDLDNLKTTRNEAYNVVQRGTCSSRMEETEYETPPQAPPRPMSSQPTTAAGDYELV